MEDKLLRSRGSGAKILSTHSTPIPLLLLPRLSVPTISLAFGELLFSVFSFYLVVLPGSFESVYISEGHLSLAISCR